MNCPTCGNAPHVANYRPWCSAWCFSQPDNVRWEREGVSGMKRRWLSIALMVAVVTLLTYGALWFIVGIA